MARQLRRLAAFPSAYRLAASDMSDYYQPNGSPLQPRVAGRYGYAATAPLRLSQEVRQLRDVSGDPACFVTTKPLHRHLPLGLVLKIEIGKRLAVRISDDE